MAKIRTFRLRMINNTVDIKVGDGMLLGEFHKLVRDSTHLLVEKSEGGAKELIYTSFITGVGIVTGGITKADEDSLFKREAEVQVESETFTVQ